MPAVFIVVGLGEYVGGTNSRQAQMKKLKTTGLEMEDWFPHHEYDQTNQLIADNTRPDSTERRGFAAAWNAISQRVVVASQAAEYLTEAWRVSPPPPREDRFAEDVRLFEFATNTCSAIECAHYAIHCAASIFEPSYFSMKKAGPLNRVTPKAVCKQLRQIHGGEKLADVLDRSHERLRDIRELRDFLTHRGLPPREIRLSNVRYIPSAIPSKPKELGTSWKFLTDLTDRLIYDWQQIFQAELVLIITGIHTFVHSRLGESTSAPSPI